MSQAIEKGFCHICEQHEVNLSRWVVVTVNDMTREYCGVCVDCMAKINSVDDLIRDRDRLVREKFNGWGKVK